jgi:hypothetical protein
MTMRDRFRTVVVVDSEYNGADRSERHHVVALVAHHYSDGQLVRTLQRFEDELPAIRHNPLPTGPDTLWVTFVGQAEWRSLIALGWELPRYCVDLFAETRCLRNLALPRSVRRGLKIRGDSLIDVCRWAGLPASDPLDKETIRDLIRAGGPWTPGLPRRILDYCEGDVQMTGDLWFRLEPMIPLNQALYRGWFTQAIGDMEDRGIPIDLGARDLLINGLSGLFRRLIHRFDHFGLCDPDGQSIRPERLITLANGHGIRWPLTRTGRPVTRLKTLRKILAGHPDLHSVIALAQGLNDLRGIRDLPVGADGRA